jgi:acyl-CoA synthetase (AMP-forming)/AMP-acid ligase II
MHQLLINGASRHPDKMALRWVDRDRSVTYAQAVDAMERMAGALGHLGVKLGDRVTIFAHNGLDYLVGMLMLARRRRSGAGHVRFADDLSYYLNDQRPTAIIYTHDMGEVVRHASRDVPASFTDLHGRPARRRKSLPDLLPRLSVPTAMSARRDSASLLHLRHHRTAEKHSAMSRPYGRRAARERSRFAAAIFRLGRRRCRVVPARRQLFSSAPRSIDRRDGPVDANVRLGRHPAAGATMFVGNPLLFGEFLAECRSRGGLPSAALPAFGDHCRRRCAGVARRIRLGWSRASARRDRRLLRAAIRRSGLTTPSCCYGPMLPDKEVRITTGGRCRQVPGEIVLRGGFMWGYWGKPDRAAEALRDGWLHSGDIGMFDADGFLTMRGRRNELGGGQGLVSARCRGSAVSPAGC